MTTSPAPDAAPASRPSTPPPAAIDARVAFFAGSANRPLAEAVARELGVHLGASAVGRFPDSEVLVQLDESVRGRQVVLLQPTAPPVDEHLVELLALADACRRAAAARTIAIVPYFGYARSDRREGRRTPVMASLVADLLETAGVAEVVAFDVHALALEGFFRIPLDNITAVPILVGALQGHLPPNVVIVSPDLGATRLASRYAELLQRPVAVCHKHRIGPAEVAVGRVTGDVRDRPCLIVDDMITTGGTIVESVRALRNAGALPELTVAATHAVFAPDALHKLAAAGVRRIIVTDTIASRGVAPEPMRLDVVSVAPLLAAAIRRLLDGASLGDLV